MNQNSYQAKNMLVTGGAGFIGCNYIRHKLACDSKVKIINLDLLSYAGSMENLNDLPDPSRHVFIQGDIQDRELVLSILRKHEIDTIVHFAAESHVDRSIADPIHFMQTNILGTFSLLAAARQCWQQERNLKSNQCRFHHISTDEVYGSLELHDPAFTEQSRYLPNSPYSASKASSDHIVRAYFHTYQLPVTTTHCSNNYGPYQHPEKLIPTIIQSCLSSKPIPIYGNGLNIRDWLYVTDHCSGIDAVIEKGKLGETYSIGGNNEWRNIDIARKICEVFDEIKPKSEPYAKLITFVNDRLGHDQRYAINASKMRDELGWEPVEQFETGIRKTIEALL